MERKRAPNSDALVLRVAQQPLALYAVLTTRSASRVPLATLYSKVPVLLLVHQATHATQTTHARNATSAVSPATGHPPHAQLADHLLRSEMCSINRLRPADRAALKVPSWIQRIPSYATRVLRVASHAPSLSITAHPAITTDQLAKRCISLRESASELVQVDSSRTNQPMSAKSQCSHRRYLDPYTL